MDKMSVWKTIQWSRRIYTPAGQSSKLENAQPSSCLAHARNYSLLSQRTAHAWGRCTRKKLGKEGSVGVICRNCKWRDFLRDHRKCRGFCRTWRSKRRGFWIAGSKSRDFWKSWRWRWRYYWKVCRKYSNFWRSWKIIRWRSFCRSWK